MSTNKITDEDSMIYRVADTMNTDLFKVDSQIRGLIESHVFNVHDLWGVKSDITICLDEHNGKLATAFFKVLGSLWGYLVVTNEAAWVLFFDGSRAKIRAGAEKEFGLGNAQATLKKLRPSVTRAFSKARSHNGAPSFWEPAVVEEIMA